MTDKDRVKSAFVQLSKAKQGKLLSSFQAFAKWVQKKFKDEYEYLKGILQSIWEWLKIILSGPIGDPPIFPFPKPPFPRKPPWPWIQ